MKKFLLSVALLGAFSLIGTPSHSNAQAVDFKDLYYPDATENGKHYALDFWDYLAGYKNITRNDFTHMKLTNDKTYDFFDYLVAYPTHKNLEKALEEVVKNNNVVSNFNVKTGKIANDGTIMDASLQDTTVKPAPRTFEVIDIK